MSDPITDPAPADPAPTHFADSFGDELKGNETIRGFESAESMASAFLESGTKMTDLQTQLDEAKGLVPVVPESYDISVPEGLESFYTEESVAGFKEFAKNTGLTQEHAAAVFELGASMNRAQKEAMDATLNSLKDQHGAKWEEKLGLTQRFIKEYGGEDLALDATVANNPNVLSMILKVAEHMSEDSIERIGGNAGGGGKSSAEIIFDKS